MTVRGVAIVTGGAAGLGEAIARRLASEGCGVVITDIDAANATRVADTITATGAPAVAVPGDVTRDAVVTSLLPDAALSPAAFAFSFPSGATLIY